MEPDAISYLDMGDAFWRGDWRHAVNALWSPLYGLVLGVVLGILHPAPYWEFSAVHAVNFGFLVGALASFDFFLASGYRFHHERARRSSGVDVGMLPDWAWYAAGFTLFIWSSLRLMWVPIHIEANIVADEGVLPDMLTSALVYLALGLLYQIPTAPNLLRPFVLLGAALGVGYLARNFVLPLGLVLLGVAVALGGGIRRVFTPLLAAVCILLVIIAPFVVALSLAQGRPTMGAGAKLYYAYHVNGVPYVHWQGGAPGGGMPTHPTRKILNSPAVYEFATPVVGTYPPWDDPAYWYDGITPRIDARAELSVVRQSVRAYALTVYRQNTALVVAALALLLFSYLSVPQYSLLRGLRDSWGLLVLSGAGFATFAWVHFEPRHLATPIVLFWMGVLALVRVPHTAAHLRAVAAILTASLIVTLIPLGGQAAGEARAIIRGRSLGMDATGHVQWEVAEGLGHLGVRPGDRVAVIGNGFYAYWARLARVRIVAQLPDEHGFWDADAQGKADVMNTLSKSGAKLAVVKGIPSGDGVSGWERLGRTEYYAHPLQQ